ncbi:MAG TPA: DNA-directed RNA polymerase subunit alpha [Dehalococcoidia bacterium]|nr:DNA-directed RNA polymerase subunit alpha [Dehalococcoidia bacterium]
MVAYEGEERPELILEEEESEETFGRIVAEPLEAGFGVTIGNALRRTLLSALPGTAITAVRIEGVEHEFTTVPHVKEDVVEFLLNVKDIRIRSLTDRPGKIYLEASGDGVVTAGQIEATADYEIVNPEQHLATLEGARAKLSVEFTVEHGRGYVPAGTSDGLPIGVIPVDAIFSPVRRVNYRIEHTRVGQVTNFDRLVLEIWTDGTIQAGDAVSQAAEVLAEQFTIFSRLGRPEPTLVGRGLGSGSALAPDRYNTPIEDLNLSVRAYNCLKRSGLMTVGAVLEKNEDELLALRNFGRKSYDELREKLVTMNFLSEEEMNNAFGTSSGGIDGEGSGPRTLMVDADADEELGPVAKALLEALKESGQDELLDGGEDDK